MWLARKKSRPEFGDVESVISTSSAGYLLFPPPGGPGGRKRRYPGNEVPVISKQLRNKEVGAKFHHFSICTKIYINMYKIIRGLPEFKVPI